MTLIQFLMLLKPLLLAILGQIQTTNPTAEKLIQLALRLLGQFQARHAAAPHTFGAAASHAIEVPEGTLPPESEWTPEGLTRFAEAHAGGQS